MDNSPEMFAVFGAGGRVGGAAVRELRRRGHGVRAVLRNPEKSKPLIDQGFEIAIADLRDSNALGEALGGINGVLAICPMNPKAFEAEAEHAALIDAIGEAIECARPQSVVAISDYGAQHETGTGIALTFHRFERRLRSATVPCTFLRSAEHMQNWRRFLKTVRETGVLPAFYRPKTKLLPLVSAPDVGLIAAEMLTSPDLGRSARVVHAEGPRRYSVEEVVNTFAAAVGRPVEAREVPPEEWTAALMTGGLSESYAQLVAQMYHAHNAGRIEVEAAAGEMRRGRTTLSDAFASMIAA